MTRRDQCYLTGKRAARLTDAEAALAWKALAKAVEDMGELDLPKFDNLLAAIRSATITGKSKLTRSREWREDFGRDEMEGLDSEMKEGQS